MASLNLKREIIASLPQAKLYCSTDEDSPCAKANSTLLFGCNGILKTPDQYIINENTFNGTYEPQTSTLAKCMCNQEFYDQLSGCIECFKNYSKVHFEVAPVTRFKILCADHFSTEFTESPPETIKSNKTKYVIGISVAVLLLIILGIIVYLYSNTVNTPLMKSFANKNRSELDVYYPPPTSLENVSHHYPPPNSQQSHPPSDTPISPVSQQQPPSPLPTSSSDYQQQQTYYPTSSNQPVSNIQIPTQSVSGEIPYYPPPANPSDLPPYPGSQNHNPPGSYYGNQY
nr:13347_t:CDS:2 [Entrophospora candida]